MAGVTANEGNSIEILMSREGAQEDYEKGKTYVYVTQLFVGMFEGFLLIGIIMTWVYHFTTAPVLNYISFFHIGIVVSFVLSTIIIPLYWKFWTKKRMEKNAPSTKGAKHGLRLLLFYIILQAANAALSSASLIWRAFLFVEGCTSAIIASECTNFGYRTVEIAYLVFDPVGVVLGILGMIMGLLLRSKVGNLQYKAITVKKAYRNEKGELVGLETTAAQHNAGNSRDFAQATPPPGPLASTHQKLTQRTVTSQVPQQNLTSSAPAPSPSLPSTTTFVASAPMPIPTLAPTPTPTPPTTTARAPAPDPFQRVTFQTLSHD